MIVNSHQSIKGYQLLVLIGEGAYGTVYRAHQEFIGREVAVKIILPDYANQPDFIRRFDAEAQLVAQLEHLHIVPLYDYWRDPQGAYLVMRLMKGGSLSDSLKETGHWAPAAAARLVDQIASALDAAHQQGVVHRDLKPANILLDEDGNAYLSDFGIAKELSASEDETQTGALLGTPAYITPEQVKSQPVTAQTDIYALGVLIYEVLVGEHPFPDSSPAELVVKHLQEALPYLRSTHPELPAALDGVIQRATAKNPESRYPSASALAEEYRRALQLDAFVPDEEIYNPYKGLRAFQEADADDFFGREALTGQLLAQLAGPGDGIRFLAVVGPSGSGKSSVVKASLIPALRKGALPGSEEWFIVETHPGSHPLQELQLALMSISADPDIDLSEILAQDEDGLLQAAKASLPNQESQLLLVIDQFEELFILVDDEEKQNNYLDNLVHAVSQDDGRVRVVVTLRADFYDRPLQHPAFGRLVEDRTAVVLPLSPGELEQVIKRPAERVGTLLEEGLVKAITTDVADQPGALPLLQYALTELFERREGRMLTNQAYQEIGGVLGALGRRAEEIYAELDQAGKQVARQLFLRLVTLGEGAEDTRRQVLRTELQSLFSEGPSQINQVIDLFGNARLLSFDHDPDTRGPTVEVAHEALLREWPRLREWLDQSRADIRLQRVLGNAAHEYLASGHDPSFLLRGSRLDQFAAWAEATDLALTQMEQDYLTDSLVERRTRQAAEAERQAHEAALERRSRNFLRGLVAVMGIAAVVAVVLTIYAFNQQGVAQSEANQRATAEANALEERQEALNQADSRATQQAIAETEAIARGLAEEQAIEERDRAVSAEQEALDQREQARIQASIGLGSQALVELESPHPERAIPLALEALEEYPYTWQSERALSRAVLNSHLKTVFDHEGFGNPWVWTAFWSADGTKILTGGDDSTVRVWNAHTGKELMRITEDHPEIGSWSPDERYILTDAYYLEAGPGFGNLRDDLAELEGFGAEESIGKPIIKIWDAESGQELVVLDTERIKSETWIYVFEWYPWSPDGDHVLAYFFDGTVRVWDTSTGDLITTFVGHHGPATQALWSPDGTMIASSGEEDGKLIIWDVESGKALHTIKVGFETDSVIATRWSPDGAQIAVRGFGGVKVYDVSTGREILNLSVPYSRAAWMKWSPGGARILTTHVFDGTARVWDAQTGQELFRKNVEWAQGADWSPSGDLIAVGGADGMVHLYDGIDGHEVGGLYSTILSHFRVEFSSNGEKLLTHGYDNRLEVFDLTEAQVSIPVNSCGVVVYNDWSPDGKQVVFGGECPPDYPVKIVDAASGEELVDLSINTSFSGDGDITATFEWSPDGTRILITYEDQTARVWDAASGIQLQSFEGHHDRISGGSWSPDSRRIATGDLSGKVIVWDSSSGNEIRTFSDPLTYINWIKWSPDGETILSTWYDGYATIWDADTGDVLHNLFPEGYDTIFTGAAWTQDGDRIFLLSTDGVVHIFDSKSGKKLTQFTTPESLVASISLSPTAERLIIGGHQGEATVWEIETREQVLSYDVGGMPLAAYSPDGSRVLITNTDGNTGLVQIFPTWHSPEELVEYAKECCLLRDLTPEERELFGMPPR